jgi:hypothetical protein
MSKSILIHSQAVSEYRFEGDPSGDEVADHIFKNNNEAVFKRFLTSFNLNIDNISKDFPDQLQKFVTEKKKLPDWVNFDLLNKSQKVFERYKAEILNLSVFLSLPYCYSLRDFAKASISTDYDNYTLWRIKSLLTFVMNQFEPHAFEKRGKGIAHILKIRLVNSIIRHRLINQSCYNTEISKPLNQQALAGFLLANSLLVIRGLRKVGIEVPYDDAMAFIHRWNVIGYLLGVDQDLFPSSGKEAFYLERMIGDCQFYTTKESLILTNELIENFNKIFNFKGIQMQLIPAYIRFLLGGETATILALPANDFLQILKSNNYTGELFRPMFNTQRNVVFKSDERIAAQFNKEIRFDDRLIKVLTF